MYAIRSYYGIGKVVSKDLARNDLQILRSESQIQIYTIVSDTNNPAISKLQSEYIKNVYRF